MHKNQGLFGKGLNIFILHCLRNNFLQLILNSLDSAARELHAPPGRVNSKRVGLMTWWLWVRSSVEANFLCGAFSPLTTAEACEKNSLWLWKEKLG